MARARELFDDGKIDEARPLLVRVAKSRNLMEAIRGQDRHRCTTTKRRQLEQRRTESGRTNLYLLAVSLLEFRALSSLPPIGAMSVYSGAAHHAPARSGAAGPAGDQ